MGNEQANRGLSRPNAALARWVGCQTQLGGGALTGHVSIDLARASAAEMKGPTTSPKEKDRRGEWGRSKASISRTTNMELKEEH